mmetsp:Transcript_20959/g.54051  ORF Transcript_20959/g.54051 Transcript_20959/m.54051 type:complete len:128 (+) Transcript_20959:404-787(+)|eukprot:CAMPEP_0119415192 /NCGR_PEP_ID=MMETSP1335-20130426/8306_1 /TAXON_ID=259385 /ORGANISM="Chrysoculter rhomboideus, Strain RCC1486" /LENGTH=127 /DNA_ID=CAMNT_0007440147 /DNA_START=336 /DNA_END=719 /DNA_ORIENTATION=+
MVSAGSGAPTAHPTRRRACSATSAPTHMPRILKASEQRDGRHAPPRGFAVLTRADSNAPSCVERARASVACGQPAAASELVHAAAVSALDVGSQDRCASLQQHMLQPHAVARTLGCGAPVACSHQER